VPFNFLRRKKPGAPEPTAEEAAAAAATAGLASAATARTGISFDGVTEEWRLLGRMSVEGRLSDALNRREAIAINDVSWAPIDGSAPFVAVPGLKSIDPYDLILVLAGEGSLPELNDAEKAAHKVHKVAYDVALEAPPFRIIGTVFLNPGMEPRQLLDRATEMFVAVVDAVAMYGEQRVGDPEIDTILVNRFYLRGVEQVDKRTGLKAQKLPGAPLGGVSWQDRS
jgi:hypothetical protein